MPVSVRLPNLTAAAHQCTISTTAPTGGAAMQVRCAGTTAFALRSPTSGTAARVDIGQLNVVTNAPTGGAVVELCVADGVTHDAIVGFLTDTITYLRANGPTTDAMSGPEMVRGTRTILDFVRQNTLKAL